MFKFCKKEFENLTLWGYATPQRKEFRLTYKLPTRAEIKALFKKKDRK
jgi:CRISPR-associated Cas5-like protein